MPSFFDGFEIISDKKKCLVMDASRYETLVSATKWLAFYKKHSKK
jgi:hypothetical protein